MLHGAVTVKNLLQNTLELLKFLKNKLPELLLLKSTPPKKLPSAKDSKFKDIQPLNSSLTKNQLNTTVEELKAKLLTGLKERLNHPLVKLLKLKPLINSPTTIKSLSFSMVRMDPQNSPNSKLYPKLSMILYSPMFSMLNWELHKLVQLNQELSSTRNSMKVKTNSPVTSTKKN